MKRLAGVVSIAFLLGSVPGIRAEEAAIPDRKAAAEGFVELLAKGNFAGAVGMFDAKMQSALPEEKLRDAWAAINTKAGRFQNRVRTQAQKVGAYDVVFVTCQFEKGPLDVKVVFDSDGKVGGLFFTPSAPKPEPQTP